MQSTLLFTILQIQYSLLFIYILQHTFASNCLSLVISNTLSFVLLLTLVSPSTTNTQSIMTFWIAASMSAHVFLNFWTTSEPYIYFSHKSLIFIMIFFPLLKHLHLVHEVKHLHQMSGTAVILFTFHPITNRQRVKEH